MTDKESEINISKYSVDALKKTEHTDKIGEDGKIHLCVDYKVSGIDSRSCGLKLIEKYQLKKEIDFAFSVSTIF